MENSQSRVLNEFQHLKLWDDTKLTTALRLISQKAALEKEHKENLESNLETANNSRHNYKKTVPTQVHLKATSYTSIFIRPKTL